VYMWTLAWDAYAFLHQPLHIFDANIYAPYPNTLAYSENLIGSALFSSPIIWLTGNIVLGVNLAALLSSVLCGVGAYLLARKLQIGVGGAFVCGLIFAFAPPRFVRMGQLHMTAMQWIPFSLAFLHSYFEGGRRRDLLFAIGFFSLQALASGHGATYLLLATLALIAWQLLFGAPLALRQRLRDFHARGSACDRVIGRRLPASGFRRCPALDSRGGRRGPVGRQSDKARSLNPEAVPCPPPPCPSPRRVRRASP